MKDGLQSFFRSFSRSESLALPLADGFSLLEPEGFGQEPRRSGGVHRGGFTEPGGDEGHRRVRRQLLRGQRTSGTVVVVVVGGATRVTRGSQQAT